MRGRLVTSCLLLACLAFLVVEALPKAEDDWTRKTLEDDLLKSTWEVLEEEKVVPPVVLASEAEATGKPAAPVVDNADDPKESQVGVREKKSKFSKGESKKIDDNEYYQLVEEFLGGVDHYKLLNLKHTDNVDTKVIRKAFRTLSLEYHPDKAKDSSTAVDQYVQINRAYEVLTTPHLRYVWDQFLTRGVPWERQYLGRWTHRYGMNRIPIIYVVSGFLLVWSILQYSSQHFRYERIMRLARNSQRFKEASKAEQEVQIQIDGLKKPSIISTMIVQLYLLPWGILCVIRYIIYHKVLGNPEETPLQVLMRERGLTEQDIKKAQKAQQKKMQKLLNSTKYKQYLRAVKKAKAAKEKK
eukprot:TRINITY_DN6782_c0_g1_i1.p1 TRINITY_DN6782_c0_g1~~TRINITY_DN6782_c0_g1_i1.p1  ORF type:complete len:356 (+),score=138.60 TRINITY_DN6782_c0_g1_i1:1-1068(+)